MSAPAAFLETNRMYFREFRDADAQLLFELDSDPEVMRFITHGEPTPLARIQNEFIPKFLEAYRRRPPQGFWAAHLRESDSFIGWFHLRPDKLSANEMEMGYRLQRPVWGRGLATEGSRALLDKSFNDWGYEKVCARTLIGNMASRRVMEKAGLCFECEFYYDTDTSGGGADQKNRAVKYSIARADYLKSIKQRRPWTTGDAVE